VAPGVWSAPNYSNDSSSTVFVTTVHQTQRVWIFSVGPSGATLQATHPTEQAPLLGGAVALAFGAPAQE
jgi:hypothetical protein